MMFLRAGDGCDVQDLGIPPNDPGVLVTVHAPLLKKGFTYQALCTYEAPETPPDAPRLCLFGPRLQGDYYELLPIQLIAWRRRVYSDKSPLYVEARWDPRHGESIDLKGMRDDPGLKGVAEARRAMKLLLEVEKRGRPSGPNGLGVTLILTLDSLSPFAEGDDVPRQRHRPFVRLAQQRPGAFKALTLTQRPQGENRLPSSCTPAHPRPLQALAHQGFTRGFHDPRANRQVLRSQGCLAHPVAMLTKIGQRFMDSLPTRVARPQATQRSHHGLDSFRCIAQYLA